MATDNRLQILISSVNKVPELLPGAMGIESDAVIVNQLKVQELIPGSGTGKRALSITVTASGYLTERKRA